MSDSNGTNRIRPDPGPSNEDGKVLLWAPWPCLRLRNQKRALALARSIGEAAAREDEDLEGADLRLYKRLILREGLDAGEIDQIDRAYWRAATSAEPRVLALDCGIRLARARRR